MPDGLAVAGVIALGHPVRRPRRLTRRPVEAFSTVDRVDGPPFGPEAAQPPERRIPLR